MKAINKRYEAPKAEIIAIEMQSVLCVSSVQSSSGLGAVTETVGVQTFDFI